MTEDAVPLLMLAVTLILAMIIIPTLPEDDE